MRKISLLILQFPPSVLVELVLVLQLQDSTVEIYLIQSWCSGHKE